MTHGDRILKVNHAGEHGAVNIYRGQRLACFWRDAGLKRELEEFRAHEERHRAIFAAELERRGLRRCRSYGLCGLGGLMLGLVTGICGRASIALDENDCRRAAAQRLDPHGAGSRETIHDACSGNARREDIEQGFPQLVRRRPQAVPGGRLQAASLELSGNDSHG